MEYVGAYLVRGDEVSLEALVDKLEGERVIFRSSPDLFVRAYRSFGVEEAADVRARARTKPVGGGQRIFALYVPAITNEAQNALLKTLEEPGAETVFFLISPAPETLLPTIRSRVQRLELGQMRESGLVVSADDFLAAPPARRVEMLKPLYEHEDEGRDLGSVLAFLAALERRFAAKKHSPERDAGLRAIYRARKYAADRGSLLKALLEHVALLSPKM